MADYVTVATVWEPLEAEIIRSILEGAGIRVFVKRDALGELYGLRVSRLARIEIQVPPDQAQQATDLIAAEPLEQE